MDKSNNIVAPLGNWITLVTKKNKNLETTKLVGISMSGGILDNPRKASKTYLKSGWIAKRGEFVVDLVNVQHNNQLAIDINRTNELIVVSHIYNTFKITNPTLFGEYLLLVFKNSIIEKRLKWACQGSVRGTLSWKNFVEIPISVPPKYKQERIVYRYQTVSKYIDLKRRINDLFEKQMTAYFHMLFDDLTEYTNKSFGELFTVIHGNPPPKSNKYLEKLYFCKEGGIPWLQVKDVTKWKCKFPQQTSEQLTQEGFKRGRCKLVPSGSVIVIGSGVGEKVLGLCMISFCDFVLNATLWGIIGNVLEGIKIPTTYIYFLIKENVKKLKQMINSSTDRVSFKLQKFRNFVVKFPSRDLIDKFNSFCEPIFELQKRNEQIIRMLLKIQKGWIETLD